MNWQAISFDWNQVRAFLATAEEGSFSAAARALGQTQPTLGRQVTALEAELGIALFERVGRGVELTPTGRDLLEHVRAMGEAATRISLAATGQAQTIEGLVRITATDIAATYMLAPALHRLRTMAPKLEIDIVAANDIQDLQRREADIAIRHVRPTAPELIARLVSEEPASLFAATSYLERRGRPATKADLAAHDFICYGKPAEMVGYMVPLGIPLTLDNIRLGSASGVVTWAMVRQGLGIAPMADQVAAASPGVERVLPDMEPIVFPVWLTTHRELHTSRRIRLVFDVLADCLSQRR